MFCLLRHHFQQTLYFFFKEVWAWMNLVSLESNKQTSDLDEERGKNIFFPLQIYRMNESQGIKSRETCQKEKKDEGITQWIFLNIHFILLSEMRNEEMHEKVMKGTDLMLLHLFFISVSRLIECFFLLRLFRFSISVWQS